MEHARLKLDLLEKSTKLTEEQPRLRRVENARMKAADARAERELLRAGLEPRRKHAGQAGSSSSETQVAALLTEAGELQRRAFALMEEVTKAPPVEGKVPDPQHTREVERKFSEAHRMEDEARASEESHRTRPAGPAMARATDDRPQPITSGPRGTQASQGFDRRTLTIVLTISTAAYSSIASESSGESK